MAIKGLACFLIGLFAAVPLVQAMNASLPEGLDMGETVTISDVIDGDTVALADGREIRLVGIQAPKLPLGRANFRTWPLAPEAKDALEQLVQGRTVTLHYAGRRQDRHGRILAHLERDDGLWVQGEMLRQGWARVYSFADNRRAIAAMLAEEETARAQKRGIWNHPDYAILTPEQINPQINRFAVVEGRPVAIGGRNERIFINFGKDWRTDFTLFMDRPAQRLMRAAGIDPLRLADRRLRVRGWVESYNGPAIEITHPEQIEILRP